MFYFLADRSELLNLLEKGGRWAEIGVFAGDNAARLLEICQPAELHLIDPWRFDLDFDWFDPPQWSPLFGDAKRFVEQLSAWADVPPGRHVNDHFDMLHRAVAQRFAADARVRIHRTTSRDAASAFPDGYFDFVYIDGDHRYESVLADLQAYDRKLNAQGILLGDDFCEHGLVENAEYGVIAAVAKFLKRVGPRIVMLNNEDFSFFLLAQNDHPEGKKLIQKVVDSTIDFIELSDALMPNYSHKLYQQSDGQIRSIPSF